MSEAENTGGTTPAATNASNDGALAAFNRVDSFVKKAMLALQGWLHHPAAQEANLHLGSALDHVEEGKALAAGLAAPAVSAVTAAANAADDAADDAAAQQAAAGTEQAEATQQEQAAGQQPTT